MSRLILQMKAAVVILVTSKFLINMSFIIIILCAFAWLGHATSKTALISINNHKYNHKSNTHMVGIILWAILILIIVTCACPGFWTALITISACVLGVFGLVAWIGNIVKNAEFKQL